jgi:glycosyltransferase involved in cell wall biosynthesis
MKVLQVHNRALYPGGVEPVMESDRSLLLDVGHEVEQFFVDNREMLAAAGPKAGLKAVWNVEAVRELRARAREMDADVVHIHTPFPLLSPAAFRVAGRSSTAVVTTVHSYRYSCIQAQFYRAGKVCELCAGKRLKLAGVRHRCYHDSVLASSALTASLVLHRAAGTFRRHVDMWIALSPFMRTTLVGEGLSPERVVVKPNTIPDPGCTRKGPGEGALFAGRLEPSKGIETLLRAWALLSDGPRLVIVGDGSLRGLVEEAASRNPRISYEGWVETARLEHELAGARFLILPSEWYEGQPIVAIQAFAAGTPIVASDVGNFSDMIRPGVNGHLFRSGDPSALAAVVAQAWAASERWDCLSRGARESYERSHSQERNRELLLDAYSRALANRRNRVGGNVETSSSWRAEDSLT